MGKREPAVLCKCEEAKLLTGHIVVTSQFVFGKAERCSVSLSVDLLSLYHTLTCVAIQVDCKDLFKVNLLLL